MKKFCLWFYLVAFLFGGFAQAHEVTSDEIADVFYKLNADPKNPKMKINHAKGFCTMGSFIPSKEVKQTLDVPFLDAMQIPTSARFSLGGAAMDDRSKVRGLAVQMQGDNGNWTMVMLNTEINFARTPEEFLNFFAMRIPENGKKIDQEKIAKLTKEVASYRKFDTYMKNVGISSSVANTAFYSVHTFAFKDKKSGKMLPARWKFIPVDGVKYLSDNELKGKDKDFLLDAFKEHIKTRPVEYKMYLIFANKGDVIDDTTEIWKGKHKEIFVGSLKLDKYEGMGCNQDVYFPSDIPEGVDAPIDPLFQIRNETYGVTFGRRQ